jgi:hypothetical protein
MTSDAGRLPFVPTAKIRGFQSFNTPRQTIAGFEAMLWLRKGFGFTGGWTVNDRNNLLASSTV